jgi:hypothetical protein
VSGPRISPLEPIAWYVVGTVAFVCLALLFGPDLNWDFLNYHLYAGLNASGKRLSSDFFAAGGQGYLVPYGYWPIAAMVMAGWPAKAVASLTAALQATTVAAAWWVSRGIFPEPGLRGVVLRFSCVTAAFAGPLVLAEVGSSFIDISSACPAVIGVALLLKASIEPTRSWRWLFLAGLAFGIAVGLKLTNAIYAGAAFLCLAFVVERRLKPAMIGLLALGLGELAGFAIVYAPWAYQLAEHFGNPFFPMFSSPAAAASSGQEGLPIFSRALAAFQGVRSVLHQRFIPQDLTEALLRPLYMLDPVSNMYVEVRAPDARFLAIFLIAPFALVLRRASLAAPLKVLLTFLLSAWIVWLYVFGNGRYLMPVLILVGPALVGVFALMWPKQSMIALSVATVIVFVQLALLFVGAEYRWAKGEWSDRLIDAELPDALRLHPATYVVFDLASQSWLAAFVHPASRFDNPTGRSLRLGPGREDRFGAILRRSERIWAVFKFDLYDPQTGKPIPQAPSQRAVSAAQVGLDVDFSQCLVGKLRENSSGRSISVMTSQGETVSYEGVYGLFFCPATFKPEIARDLVLDPRRELAFSMIEQACPRQFPRGRGVLMCSSEMCTRSYYSNDTNLNIESNGNVWAHYYGAFQQVPFGTVDSILKSDTPILCGTGMGRYKPFSPGESLFIR